MLMSFEKCYLLFKPQKFKNSTNYINCMYVMKKEETHHFHSCKRLINGTVDT